MSNETVKRHHPQQQPPEVFDPNIPLDTELLFKDPLKPKESEHEQEWKFRQVRVYAMKAANAAAGPLCIKTAKRWFIKSSLSNHTIPHISTADTGG